MHLHKIYGQREIQILMVVRKKQKHGKLTVQVGVQDQ